MEGEVYGCLRRGALLVTEAFGVERRDEIIRALRDAAVPEHSSGEPAERGDLRDEGMSSRDVVHLLLVADEPIFREGLLRLLDRFPAVRVAGWTDRVGTAVLMAPAHQPDALLVCVQTVAQLHDLTRQLPGTPVLALLPAPTMDDISGATARGVLGILDRTAEIDDIVEALRVVRRGLVVHPPVARTGEAAGDLATPAMAGDVALDATTTSGAPAADDVDLQPAYPADEPQPAAVQEPSLAAVNGNGLAPRAVNGLAPDLGLLTPREREILQLLVDGYSVKQVASRLGIAMQTGKNHIHNIMSKVGASTRLQLCSWANDHGMLPSRPLLPGAISEDDGF